MEEKSSGISDDQVGNLHRWQSKQGATASFFPLRPTRGHLNWQREEGIHSTSFTSNSNCKWFSKSMLVWKAAKHGDSPNDAHTLKPENQGRAQCGGSESKERQKAF